jgi:beta-phosphoglucomutase-like phosphatase (HAD superfamily)
LVFDLDGVLVKSEQLWTRAREQLVAEHGGRVHRRRGAGDDGMSSLEWARYMHDVLRVPLAPEDISAAVVTWLENLYRDRLPPRDAHDVVVTPAARRRLALASPANREIIDLVLEHAADAQALAVSGSRPVPNFDASAWRVRCVGA